MIQHIAPRDFYNIMQGEAREKYVCVDVSTEAEHDMERIARSVNIPLDQLKSHVGKLQGYEKVYIYCASGNRSIMACQILERNGIVNLVDISNGLNGWKMEKLPTVGKGKNRIPLMQQVLIVVGTAVSGSIIASYFVNELFLLIPLAMSLGLLYAGFSGNCLMTKILIKMPWNQHKF